jgi:plastocyanin
MTLGLSEFRWYYGFFGVVMVVAFFSPAWKAYDFASRGMSVDAKVVDFAAQKTTISAGSMVTFTFRDEVGQEYTGSDVVYGGWYPPADKIIRIRYLPQAPGQSAVVEGNIHRLPIILFCIGAGIVILALASELHVRYVRSKQGRESQGMRSGKEHGSAEFRENE